MNHYVLVIKVLLVFTLVSTSTMVYAQPFITEGRTALAVKPIQTTDVKKAVINLYRGWEINTTPGEKTWITNAGHWKEIKVPGEPAMQGFKIENDKEFFYRITINIPVDAKNKKVLLRFNGVYSYARVFVNGHFVREHFGGFTSWDADISPFITAGVKANIHVGVTDRVDDISYASGYAHHTIGGILRNVQLLLLPEDFINRFYVQNDLSDNYKKATLTLNVAKYYKTNGSKIKFQLYDPNGKAVFKFPHEFILNHNGQGKYSVIINNPYLWNEEQPYLYTLKAEFIQEGRILEKIEQKIGLREVKVDGKRLLVNGQPVKLRGACRHDMHPLLGRSTNRFYDSLDVILAKEANINFIRTSHYPPSQDFLEFADRYGLYVQEETAVCFSSKNRTGIYKRFGETYNDTSYTSRYVGQLSEMIDRDRNHPAVIMWSIGNESTYGINFQKEYEFIKSVDISKPVSWSFPGTAISQNKRCFDIAVAHYPKYNGTDSTNAGLHYKDMEHDSLPLLSDEWAHVACYNTTLLKMDPNIKDFWGRSLDSMWANRFDVPGNLGGAIWGMIDETFYLPDSVTGYGPWGIVDVWRRKKAEFWNTKKAYSPVKILQTEFNIDKRSPLIKIPVKNRFNHLSLKQVKLKITTDRSSYFLRLPDINPHESGILPLKLKSKGRSLLLQFYDAKNNLLDEERISLSINKNSPQGKQKLIQWNIAKAGDFFYLQSGNLLIQLSTSTGKLISTGLNGNNLLTGPPRVFINKPKDPFTNYETSAVTSGEYSSSSFSIDTSSKNQVIVSSKGFAGNYPVKMTSRYSADGTIRIDYEADSIPPYTWQIGIAFPLSDAVKKISWKRKGYWSTYPDNHISAIEGTALRYTNIKEPYRIQPTGDISESMVDYYLSKSVNPENSKLKAAEAYRATKENILSMDLITPAKKIRLISGDRQAAKMNILPSGKQELLVMDKWDYWGLGWGNFMGSKNNSATIKGMVIIQLIQ